MPARRPARGPASARAAWRASPPAGRAPACGAGTSGARAAGRRRRCAGPPRAPCARPPWSGRRPARRAGPGPPQLKQAEGNGMQRYAAEIDPTGRHGGWATEKLVHHSCCCCCCWCTTAALTAEAGHLPGPHRVIVQAPGAAGGVPAACAAQRRSGLGQLLLSHHDGVRALLVCRACTAGCRGEAHQVWLQSYHRYSAGRHSRRACSSTQAHSTPAPGRHSKSLMDAPACGSCACCCCCCCGTCCCVAARR